MTTESQSALKILKGKRGSIKASLTKFNTYLNSINEDNANPTQIKVRLVKTKELWSDFFDINAQIKALEQDENNDIEEQHFDDSYFNVITFAEELLAQHPSGSQESSGNRKRDIESQVRLPRIELPSFSGAFDQWLPFYETFKSLIESNDTINQVQKFHYLKSCLKGEAANCVKELQISDKNYDIAWTTLKERYDNKKLIIQKHIQAIHELPACKGENSGVLRQIIDGVQKHTRSLKALERPVEHWDDWLVYLIGSKIDHSSIKEWESTINANTIPTFKEMVDFLSRKCNTLETIMKSTNNQPSKQKTALAHFSNCVSQCFVCKGNHAIYNCPRFLKMGSEQRLKEIRNVKVCHNCFKSGHHQSKCFSSSCKICNQKHNTLLHASDTSKVETHASPAQGEDSKAVLTHTSRLQDMSRVLLSTAIVKIKDASGLFHKCRVLLDSGSQSNFICKALALKLNLKPNSVNIPVIGIGQSRSQITQTVEVSIKSQQNALSMNLNCFILETITNDIPSNTFNKAALNIPQNLRLADPELHVSRKIDFLIGAELFWQLICIGRISVANTQLILQKTKLGWIISGPILCNDYLPSSTICNSAITQPLESIITKFWEIEECPKKAAYTAEELACENHFVETHTRNSEGRFIVKLPVKTDPNQCLGDSRDQAVKRFHSLERKLLKQPELRKQYIDFIDEYIELKHMKPVAQVNANGERHGQFYLPHHAVLKSDSLTTKLRVVFDGSAKSSSGHSLNDILMAGPVVQQDLFSITCRFRTHNIVLTADIEKMYRQVLVDESQTPLQQIMWRSDPGEQLKTYQLTMVTYGTTSASFLAVRALKQLAIDEAEEFPVASRITQSDFYVDDLLTGADSETDVRLIFKEINALLNKGGFRLRKWASNCPHILSELLPDATEPTILKLDKNASLKTLGLQWNSSKDMLEYAIPLYTAKGRITKRTVLSQMAQIFDPLGLIGPNTVRAELVSSLDATAFLNALKRFLARRGMVSNIYSDNGSNFVRANKELRELHNLFQNTEGEVIANTLAAEGISWHFNPPRAPHFGGIWEAAVRSFKQHFKRIVGNALLTFEEMSTVITQIEAVLNSRPLIPLSEDPNDLTILTPAHFLIGDSLRSNLEPNLLSLNVNRLTRLQLIEQLRQHLWKRWSKDYLQCLQQRNKSTKNSSVGLNVGQLVIIKEDNSPPLLWSIGRVVETHPGNDGVTRAATVRTSRGEVKRPANKLCLLPMNNDIK